MTVNISLLAAIVLATRDPGFLMAEQGPDLNDLINGGLVETNPSMVDGSKIAARATGAGIAESERLAASNANDQANQSQGFGGGFGAAAAGGFGSNAPTGAQSGAASAETPANTQAPATSQFAIVGGFVPPAKPKRQPPQNGIAGTEKYPFSTLKAPVNGATDAFFVPATEKMPDPATSLVSAVSAANRRYAEVTGKRTVEVKGKPQERNEYKYSRKFEVFEGARLNGAYAPKGTPNAEAGAWIARTDAGVTA